jgi:hypothetical protein
LRPHAWAGAKPCPLLASLIVQRPTLAQQAHTHATTRPQRLGDHLAGLAGRIPLDDLGLTRAWPVRSSLDLTAALPAQGAWFVFFIASDQTRPLWSRDNPRHLCAPKSPRAGRFHSDGWLTI